MQQIDYVVGFAFDSGMNRVLLIEKNHPEWQAGKLNGIGGKIELGETPQEAMFREAQEEAGVINRWIEFCTLIGPGFRVNFFWTTSNIDEAKQQESERLHIVDCNAVATHALLTIPNLAWLIPMAKSMSRGEKASEFFIQEAHYEDR